MSFLTHRVGPTPRVRMMHCSRIAALKPTEIPPRPPASLLLMLMKNFPDRRKFWYVNILLSSRKTMRKTTILTALFPIIPIEVIVIYNIRTPGAFICIVPKKPGPCTYCSLLTCGWTYTKNASRWEALLFVNFYFTIYLLLPVRWRMGYQHSL